MIYNTNVQMHVLQCWNDINDQRVGDKNLNFYSFLIKKKSYIVDWKWINPNPTDITSLMLHQ